MILGIDLGTTYSVCAYLDENGEPKVVENCDGGRVTPSVVQIEGEHVHVGEIAKDHSITDPQNVISTVKNYMGSKHIFRVSSGKEYNPETISGFIIKKLVQDASQKLKQEINDVVITVPAYFSDAQRESTKQAAQLAGVNMIASVNEPTAAALYYAHENKLKKANIMVYDLGGGTFDVTVINIDGETVEVKSTCGISRAGGHFFDQEIVDYICKYMYDKHEIDLEDEEYQEELQEVYIKAEKCKIQLSGKDKSEIVLKIGKVKEVIPITREFLESKIHTFYMRSESKMKEALRNAGMKIEEIDEILLVGGSSKVPYISKKIEEFFGKKPSIDVNPDEAVALGAALYKVKKTGFSDVCSHSIGVVTIDKERLIKRNTILIKKNTKIPATVSQKFKTFGNNTEQIRLIITEGEFSELENVTILGDFPLELPEGLPKDTGMEVLITLDEHQIVHVFMEIESISMHKEFHFERLNNISDEEVKKLSGLIVDMEVE